MLVHRFRSHPWNSSSRCCHCRQPSLPLPLPMLPLHLPSLLPASFVAVAIAHVDAIAVACLPPLLPSLLPWLPLPSLLHDTFVAITLAAIAITLFVVRHPHCSHHHPYHPHPLHCCPHHPPHALIICLCLLSWLCGCWCSLASHRPPLMLLLLVDFYFFIWLLSNPLLPLFCRCHCQCCHQCHHCHMSSAKATTKIA